LKVESLLQSMTFPTLILLPL